MIYLMISIKYFEAYKLIHNYNKFIKGCKFYEFSY